MIYSRIQTTAVASPLKKSLPQLLEEELSYLFLGCPVNESCINSQETESQTVATTHGQQLTANHKRFTGG